ncbi:hypothetical protein [Phenylobacterium sp.]|uniref:hypothetical protein n=1 Tax=Phenylobacterium sp. TaxID=1871053 RepID=UPI0025CE905C|nr:hypothetical protein [Phenylobacterium sp.]
MAPSNQRRGTVVVRTALAVLAILVLAVLAHVALPLAVQPRLPPPNRMPAAGAPLTYDAALEQARERVQGAGEVAAAHPDEWLHQEGLAGAWIALARLTGDFDAYAQAQAALDRAFALAPPRAGPHMTQASLDFTLHRLGHAEAMVEAFAHYAVPPEREDVDEVAGMRGDLAFYRGRYALAWRWYSGGKTFSPSLFRQAVYQGRTGQADAALASIDAQEREMRFPQAQSLANLELQRGALELQRGDWPRATTHFAKAQRLFPGYWLAQAHSAQMLALSGHRAEAIARFTDLAGRSGAPEVMDALAAVYRAEGDSAHAELWAARAGTIWARRVQQIPEAAWGHAVEHELAFGDPARALDLALKDYRARPYGVSAVTLASAYVANRDPAEALRILQPLDHTPFVSADGHATAAQAYELLGDAKGAEAERRAALKINPHCLDRDTALIWFGH